MSKRPTDREKLLKKISHLSDSEIKEVLNYLSKIDSSGKNQYQVDAIEDELVSILSSAYENRRARQVFEWEAARQRAEARSVYVKSARR